MKQLNVGNQLLEVIERGACISRWMVNGKDLLLRYANIEEYEENPDYLNVIIGPTAGRYEKDGRVILHGGECAVSKKNWTLETEENSVRCTLEYSKDDNLFGGELKICVTYTLLEDALVIDIMAKGEEKSICNLTNHLYFNTPNLEDTMLQFSAKQMALTCKKGLRTAMSRVPDAYDFQEKRRIEECVLDHAFLLDSPVLLEDDETILTISSTSPACVLYSLNHPQGSVRKRSALAVEMQYLPNDTSVYVDKNSTYKEKIIINWKWK